MPKNLLFPKLTLIALSLMNAGYISAETRNISTGEEDGLYNARVTGQFLGGGNQQLGGFVDGMVPVWYLADQLFFADASAMFGQRGRATYSGGLGYRGMYNKASGQGIVGAYTFIDYFRTTRRNMFWQVNPGMEWLTTQYEARLQAYIPVSDKQQTYARSLASNLPANILQESGRQNSNLFGATGHRIFDTRLNLVEQVGTGVELEVGRHFNLGSSTGTWVRVGGYHYNFNGVTDVNGAQANVEIGINHFASLLLQNNYDNQNKNRFAVGLRTNFGGANTPVNTLANRMQAPIIRHQARQSYGEKDPTRLNFQARGPSFDIISNGWFFSPNGSAPPGAATTFANCTAEAPCLTIDSATAEKIQQLAPKAKLLFETGSYAIPGNDSNVVSLWHGQKVLGRNTGWFLPAATAERPIINGGLFWGDVSNPARVNSNGYIEHAVVNNDNQVVSSSATGLPEGPVIAVGATGNMTTFETDTIAMHRTADYAIAFAVYAGNNATVTGGTHTATATTAGAGNAIANGVEANGGVGDSVEESHAQVEANTNATATANGDGSAYAFGVSAPSGNATVTGGTHTATSTSERGEAEATGVSANGAGGGGAVERYAQVEANTNATATANGDGGARAFGVRVANGNATVTGGTHRVTATAIGGATAWGVFASGGAGDVNANKATVTASTISATANGTSPASANAIGVAAPAGSVTDTAITLNGNGTNLKCTAGVTSDGSCI